MDNIAIYPGTFDPPTNGHIDLVKRSLRMFDKVIVAMSVNPTKTPMFSFDERKQFFMDEFQNEERLSFVSFDKELLVSFSKKVGAQVIIRGLRAVSDFDYELQMTLMNRYLDESVETIFLMPIQEYSFVSSSIVKEVASLGGDVSSMVPSSVLSSLKEQFNK